MSEGGGTYIRFVKQHLIIGRKTEQWAVTDLDDGRLGRVGWFAQWRKYYFYPADGCAFEEVCLREIAAFLVARTAEHKGRTKR